MLFHVDWFVQIVVDESVLSGLIAHILVGWRHANEVDLVESESFRTHPGMFRVLRAVMEDFTADRVISVVTIRAIIAHELGALK